MNTSLNPRDLNRRITIQQQTTAQDDFGGPLQTWSNVYSCWASVDVQSSQLIYSTVEFIEKVIYRITFRFTKSVVIVPNNRIQYVDPLGTVHTYEIQSIIDANSAHIMLVALCYELAGSQ